MCGIGGEWFFLFFLLCEFLGIKKNFEIVFDIVRFFFVVGGERFLI